MTVANSFRFIGVLGDGTTDREIISHLITVLLEGTNNSTNKVETVLLNRQNMRDNIDKFWIEYQKESTGKSGLLNDSCKRLENAVVNVLYGAVEDFKNTIGRDLNRKDMIILSSDAEKYLINKDAYFDEWAWMLEKIVHRGIEKYYHVLSGWGYAVDNLPLIIPIIPFPSTEIIIASARAASGETIIIRGKQARELKKTLYRTYNLNSLEKGQLRKFALSYLTNDCIKDIYKDVPEIRTLFQTLYYFKS